MAGVRLTVARVAMAVAVSGMMSACTPPEDPSKVELRGRLERENRLSDEELGRLSDEVARTVESKSVRITEPGGSRLLTAEQQGEVFNMLHNRAGMYDEGLRREGGTVFRILNAPGKSDSAEVEATQRLWVEVETLLPRRYEFTYAFQGYGDFAYDLTVGP